MIELRLVRFCIYISLSVQSICAIFAYKDFDFRYKIISIENINCHGEFVNTSMGLSAGNWHY